MDTTSKKQQKPCILDCIDENDPEQMSKSLLNEILELNVLVKQKQERTIKKEVFDALIDDIAVRYNTTPAIAMAGLYITLQAGGTNNSKRANIKITIGDILFESKVVNSIIIKTCKNVTPRQLAKIFANQIVICAEKFNITGNAFVYINRYYPEMLKSADKVENERYWCSDFQVENEKCPQYIREALRQRYSDKFGYSKRQRF